MSSQKYFLQGAWWNFKIENDFTSSVCAKTTNLAGEVAPVFGGGAGALVVLHVEHLARLRPPQELELAFRLLGLHRRRFTVSLHVNSSVSRLF